jgi:hydroxysqualene dehydroxylase
VGGHAERDQGCSRLNARRVVVLGGGLAGITAALDCAEAGARVTLLEVRPRLGGAAYSFERDGLWLDNGQHVFLRCCTAYRGLLARLESCSRVSIQPRLEIPVLTPGGRPKMLRRSGLPAPLHLGGALLRYPHLSLGQRLRAARAALMLGQLNQVDALEQERREQTTLGMWLAARGQTPASVAALWDLIALPTLNLPAAQGSLALGAFVLQRGLLDRNDAGDIGFHLRPLKETLGDPAERALAEAGVDVRLGVRGEAVMQTDVGGSEEKPRGGLLVRAGGVELQADAVVCAVPHERASGLLAPLLGARAESWQGLGASPIVNVHIVYDRRVCGLGFAAGVGTPVQYLFDRSDAAGLSEGQYLAVSLSGAAREMGASPELLGERYVEAMRELLPGARRASVRNIYVSREHAATFAARPGTQALRPGARTKLPGLVLAGAWTDTGWPATLEGAVLSGHIAAREVLR